MIQNTFEIQFKLWIYIINIFYVAASKPEISRQKWYEQFTLTVVPIILLISTEVDASAQILFKE